MDLTGKIIAVMPASSGVSQRTGNSWMSQDYVIEVPGQYPRRCVFRVFGEDRIKQFNIQMGQDYTVSFDIDAHEYQGRWFNDIRAYSVVPAVAGAAPAAGDTPFPTQQPVAGAAPFPPQQPIAGPAPEAAATPFPPAQDPAGDGSTDDLPF